MGSFIDDELHDEIRQEVLVFHPSTLQKAIGLYRSHIRRKTQSVTKVESALICGNSHNIKAVHQVQYNEKLYFDAGASF